MRKIAMMAAGVALAAGTLATVAPAAQAATTGTCPSGAVCLEEPNGTILSKNIWYSYGAHNLSGVSGQKVVINSQTGGAGFKLCLGYNGQNCYPDQRGTGRYLSIDYTPINSIVLFR
jgi:hypothetical protein